MDWKRLLAVLMLLFSIIAPILIFITGYGTLFDAWNVFFPSIMITLLFAVFTGQIEIEID
jgi:hypothetical protein